MSGRIRSVKPDWLEDEKMVTLPTEARVLSVGLLLLADDYGNGRGSDLYLHTRVFPADSRETLTKAIEALEGVEYVVRYQVNGQTYFHIRNWDRHQKVDHRGKPKVPEFTGVREDSRQSRESIEKDGDGVAPRAIPSTSISPPEGGVGETNGRSSETPCPMDLPDRCEQAGIPEQFAKAYRAPLEAVRAHVDECLKYWTVGPGTGRRKRNWLQVVRSRLHELGKAGKLDEPPGGSKSDDEHARLAEMFNA